MRSISFPPVDESDFTANILLPIYESREVSNRYDSIHFHKVSVLFIVLAGGTILVDESDNIDLTHSALSSTKANADQYFRLSRAAFSAETLGNKSNTWTIATLLVMLSYYVLVDVYDSEKRWLFLDLILRTSHLVGFKLIVSIQVLTFLLVDWST